MSDCSIVIPVHNRASLTRECLDALLDQDLDGAEIVVVDDCSGDDTPEMLASYGDRLRTLRMDPNGGFAAACNAGVAACQSELVVLLNNDTQPVPGWLGALTAYADEHPEAGVVGCKLLWPTGAVQHAGVVIDAHKDVRHVYLGFPADHPAVNYPRRFQVVTAACVLIRRELFEQLGGLDTAYRNGYEDVDFCLRAGELGHEVHYCPTSVLYHLESASRGYEDLGDQRNRQLYKSRWAARVRQDDVVAYAQDGLLEVEYAWLSVNAKVAPLLGAAVNGSDGNSAEQALTWRSRQCFELIRENSRLALDSAAPAPWGERSQAPSGPGWRAPPPAADPLSPPPTEEAAVAIESFTELAARYDDWPSGAPYDWGGATRGGSVHDTLDFHVDLGCGTVKKGRIGVDRFPAPGVNVVCDLERLETYAVADAPGQDAQPAPDAAPLARGALPFADGSIRSIVTHHCLEHIGAGLVALMDECWRVLAADAPLRIIVPLFPSWSAVVDPDHRRFFVADEHKSTFDYFCGSTDHCWMEDFAVPYTRARFEKVDQDLTARPPSPQDWWTPADARELRVTLRAVK